jgi:hypothetical protein
VRRFLGKESSLISHRSSANETSFGAPLPYQILYEIEIEEIIIYAIYHSARDPEAWKRRKDG